MYRAFAISVRGASALFFKQSAEVESVINSNAGGNFENLHVGMFKKMFAFVNNQFCAVFVRRHTGNVLKGFDEMVFTHIAK